MYSFFSCINLHAYTYSIEETSSRAVYIKWPHGYRLSGNIQQTEASADRCFDGLNASIDSFEYNRIQTIKTTRPQVL